MTATLNDQVFDAIKTELYFYNIFFQRFTDILESFILARYLQYYS